MNLTIRRMRPGEEGRLYEVLRAAVIHGTTDHYNEAQRRAWAPSQPFAGWVDNLRSAESFVAVVDNLVAGFMTVSPDGHLDFAFVAPEFHRQGIGRALLDRAEREMQLTGIETMTTGASLVARAFFAQNGWREDAEEVIERSGQKLRRFRMHKRLPG